LKKKRDTVLVISVDYTLDRTRDCSWTL